MQRMSDLGSQVVTPEKATPAGLRDRLKTEIDKWTPIIGKAVSTRTNAASIRIGGAARNPSPDLRRRAGRVNDGVGLPREFPPGCVARGAEW